MACNRSTLVSTVPSVRQNIQLFFLMPVSTRSQSPGWWVGGGYSIVNKQTLISLTHSGCRASVSNLLPLQSENFQKQISILTLLLCNSQQDSNLSAGSASFDRVTSDLHYRVRSWLWQTDTRKACITKNQWHQAVSLSKACHNSLCSNLSSGMVGRKSKIRMICIVVWLMSPLLRVLQEFEYLTLHGRHDEQCSLVPTKQCVLDKSKEMKINQGHCRIHSSFLNPKHIFLPG